ncbi:MAG: ferric reductase-like transmembrane domain-containing protein [Acidobacteriota bacterium]|nr:ferric reductase-like transmembrane domain-containing protein [Acidobacteriota bacterium]
MARPRRVLHATVNARSAQPLLAALAWMGVYLALVLAPLFVLLVGAAPPGLGFRWDLSMALGFAGLTMMAVQFALTARFRRATAPFGIDIIYYLHRYLGALALALVLAHALIAIAVNPAVASGLNPFAAPWYMTAGVASVAALVALVIASVWRRTLRIPYEPWRVTHTLLAVAAVGLAWLHMHGVQYYLASPWKYRLWQIIGWSCLGAIAFVRLVRPWQLQRRPYRVAAVTPERGDAWTVAVAPEGHAGLTFQPGQFAWLTLGRSPYVMQEHPFSFSSSPALGHGRLEFTIKELGDFTRTIGTLPPGTRAFVDGPYGAFSIDRHPAPGYVCLAGGIGIAPMLSMLKALADRGDPRPVLLFYADSQWDRMTGREQIEALRRRLTLSVVYVVDEPTPEWEGERGWITREVVSRHLPVGHAAFEYFVCGPTPMIGAMERILHGLGVPLSQVHSELFDLV